jgi:chromosome partitioning protein
MHRTEIAAFLNQKGGVGKTTSVVNVGSGLTILGKNVLIVDLDPQGHLTGSLGIDNEQIKHTVYDVMCGEATAGDSFIKKELGARLSVNGRDSRLSLTVMPSNLHMAEAELVLAQKSDREYLLKNAISSIEEDFDYILFDCPPGLGLFTINALAAAHKVFIPVQTEYLALESLNNLQTMIESVTNRFNRNLEIGGLIATRFDGRKVINRAVVERLKERFGALFLESMIRENIVLAEGPERGKDIFTYRPRSYGAEDYLNLCHEILDGNHIAEEVLSVEPEEVIGRHSISRMIS